MYRYQFTSTVGDLLEAEESERAARAISRPLRSAMAIVGIAWLTISIIALCSDGFAVRILVWIIISITIIFVFAARPYIKRVQIKRGNALSQDVMLEFFDNSIMLHVGNVGNYVRKWEEFEGFTDTDKGVLFYFSDGTVNWLPNRVFCNSQERIHFIKFLCEKQTQRHGQEC